MKIAVDIDEVLKDQDINREYYNRKADIWSERKTNSFWHEKEFVRFHKYFKKGGKILDIGSAYGIHVPLFLGIGKDLKYEGVDISSSMLKIARKRYPQLKFNIANILKFSSLPCGQFDGFWAAAILMHIAERDWPTMMANIEKIMKSEAVGYITLPTQRPNLPTDPDQRIFSFWKPDRAKKILTQHGWQILQQGKCLEYNNSGWWWMIVKLPKK